jgi:hypothetical protein
MPASKSNARSNGGSSKTSSSAKADGSKPKYSKWINSPSQHAERKGQSLATKSHDVIRQWAEERKAKPTTVEGQKDNPRVLRMDFPGYGGDNLVEISWDDWFKTFDDRDVVFIYQEQLRSGDQSNFFKLSWTEDSKPKSSGGTRRRKAA